MKLRILPYKPGSRSAKLIARGCNGLRVRFDGHYRPRRRHLVVNWGKAAAPHWWPQVRYALNQPEAVRRASNKLVSFQRLQEAGVSIPLWTTDAGVAKQWLLEKGGVVVGRQILNGHGGIGCIVWEDSQDTPAGCPLYTRHLRHKREYRIHVFQGTIIDAVEKRRKRGFENRNGWIRNHVNGYVFCRDGLVVPEPVKAEAIKATAALGLDFGAVDVAFREKEGKAYIFEVNTAPGVEGTTIQSYIKAINDAKNKV